MRALKSKRQRRGKVSGMACKLQALSVDDDGEENGGGSNVDVDYATANYRGNASAAEREIKKENLP